MLWFWESNMVNDGLLQNLNDALGTDYSTSDVNKMLREVKDLENYNINASHYPTNTLIDILKRQDFPMKIGKGIPIKNSTELIQKVTDALNSAPSWESTIWME